MPNRPTTGFTALHVAKSLCREIKVYGYGISKYFNYSKYYDKSTNLNYIQYPHNYKAERKILRNEQIKKLDDNFINVIGKNLYKN